MAAGHVLISAGVIHTMLSVISNDGLPPPPCGPSLNSDLCVKGLADHYLQTL